MFRPRGIMGSREFALCDIPKWPGQFRSYLAARRAGREDRRKEAAHHG